MLRLLLTPRWLVVTVFVLIAFPVCIRLGIWQWDRAHQKPRALTVEEERAVPVSDLLDGRPADLAFPTGLLVRVTGQYRSGELTATGIDASGERQRWAVSPVVQTGVETPLAAVRGTATPQPSAPVAGDVVITARMQPPAPADLRGGLTAERLAADGLDPRGYLVLTSQQPPDVRAATPVAAVPPPPQSPGMRWQNSMYAVQWWIFGLFFVFAWVRFFRDDLRQSRASTEAAPVG